MLAVLAPLLLLIAVVIASEGRGVLFRQRRTGLNGRVFTILKFRTMTVAEDGGAVTHARPGDPRVTRIGGVLRAASLDELPQLINVLRGDMSLVGPRPHAVAHDHHYAALLPRYRERFAVRPGLTGLAQVRGLRGEIRQLGCMACRIEADLHYARHWSFRTDLLILWRTAPAVLSRVNAC
ncbi:sugar transferase [Brevundimonas sp. PAMC22021]|nr:sugar transferase [Brevundimonas sp. PAMC22021]